MRSVLVLGCLVALVAFAAPAGVSRWSSTPVSSADYESHPAFDPVTRALIFVRSSPDFSGWRLFTSECGPSGWTAPHAAPFAGDGVEADPYFTPDGATLYFISSRSEAGVKQRELDIWRVGRGADGAWRAPERLPEPVNSSGQEWFPRLASDGWLYFGSDRPGGHGATDIYRARTGSDAWVVENLGPAINTAGDEYEAEVSRNADRLIIMADGDLFESRRAANGWSARTGLGTDVNSPRMEVGPLLSPDGERLLFARDSGDPQSSGELYLYARGGSSTWPPICAR